VASGGISRSTRSHRFSEPPFTRGEASSIQVANLLWASDSNGFGAQFPAIHGVGLWEIAPELGVRVGTI
jgi:hypothetical protein